MPATKDLANSLTRTSNMGDGKFYLHNSLYLAVAAVTTIVAILLKNYIPYSQSPSSTSTTTQFQGASNFRISGNPAFSNIGVNNVKTVNNNGEAQGAPILYYLHALVRITAVDSSGQKNYDIDVGTQYGNTNAGDGQHNGGGTYVQW